MIIFHNGFSMWIIAKKSIGLMFVMVNSQATPLGYSLLLNGRIKLRSFFTFPHRGWEWGINVSTEKMMLKRKEYVNG